jgi:hypothetical protein
MKSQRFLYDKPNKVYICRVPGFVSKRVLPLPLLFQVGTHSLGVEGLRGGNSDEGTGTLVL